MQINATAQTSRFHVDTLNTLSTEIDLKDVTISISDHDIIVDSHLKLKEGVHYALVGRNGVGKSTLLKAIAERIIPGIPKNLRILLVDQVEGNVSNLDSTSATVTQTVVQSDVRRQTAIEEHQKLTKAFDSSSVNELASAVASIKLGRSIAELEEAKNIALRRSGARGADARKELIKAEAKVKEDEERVERTARGDMLSDASEDANGLLQDVQTTLDSIDASATEANARSILTGLGFSSDQLDAKFSSLSGGWRSRCSLASALLQKPNLLIIDEPTNFLDIQSIIWLQNYLISISSTILIVAHDREFVDNIADEVIILRKTQLTYFEGNLSEYETDTRKVRKNKLKMQGALDKKKEAIEKSIGESKRTAKKTGDDNRLRMAKSRQKKLDDRFGLERSAKGGRFKLNRDLMGYHLTSRAAIEIDELDPPIKLPIPDPDPLRFPGALISASDVSFKYPKMANTMLDGMTLAIHPGGRVGLLGLNGRGKSTVIKLLVGALKPIKGAVERHSRLRMGYYSQHSVEELSDVKIATQSALEYFRGKLSETGSADVDEGTARSFLGSFGLGGKKALIPIGTLSGGQKVRLALAIVVYPAPDLLVLDEVSTHLDLETITALIYALRAYTGGILLVSHDRHLMKCVIEGTPVYNPADDAEDGSLDGKFEEEDGDGGECAVGSVYMVGSKGNVKLLSGGMDEYVRIIEKKMRKGGLLE